jgi:hypothetical protein
MAANMWDGLKGFAIESRNRAVSEHDRAVYFEGFSAAAGIFTLLLDAQIRQLDSRLELGTLGPDDQKILSTLRTLRSASGEKFHAHFDADKSDLND